MNNRTTPKAPVMLLFFNRPQCLQQVFDAVRRYKPKQLFLVQDGARAGRDDDVENIKKCREIVESIDWDCTVYRNYATENMTCDHREYTGIDWCFQYVDRLIILEDDCVPSQSFMKLCEECLEKYKEETSIHSIYGFNRIGDYDCPYDYVFSKGGCGWGWATWKRVWDRVNTVRNSCLYGDPEALSYMQKVSEKCVDDIYGNYLLAYKNLKEREKNQGIVVSWELWAGLAQIFYDMVTIAPARNLVQYIGITHNATHTASDARVLPHKVSRVLMREVHELEGEILHPPFIFRDTLFEKLSMNSMRYPPFVARAEVGLRKLWYHVIMKNRKVSDE